MLKFYLHWFLATIIVTTVYCYAVYQLIEACRNVFKEDSADQRSFLWPFMAAIVSCRFLKLLLQPRLTRAEFRGCFYGSSTQFWLTEAERKSESSEYSNCSDHSEYSEYSDTGPSSCQNLLNLLTILGFWPRGWRSLSVRNILNIQTIALVDVVRIFRQFGIKRRL